MWLLLACVDPPQAYVEAPVAAPTAPAPAPPPAWPEPGAVHALAPRASVGRLLLDAGHGAPDNNGNTNAACEREGDVMRRVADGVAGALPATLTVLRTRPDPGLVDYPTRLRMSRDADWLVSLHSDSRAGRDIAPSPAGCWQNVGALGFSVLWSDEGAPPLVAARERLAVAIRDRMVEAGFLAYDGHDYVGLYEGTNGVFVDRHAPSKRIMLLRRPAIPSVIIETHQAWDPAEVERWTEPATWTAFAAALGVALDDVRAP